MEGIKRSLLYWGKIMEQNFWRLFLGIGATIIFMSITVKEGVFEMALRYMPMLGMIVVLSQASSNANYYLPEAISFGATRKENVIGMQVFTHIMVFQAMIVMMFGAKYVLGFTNLATMDWLSICVILFLIGCGAGNGVCATFLRYGKTAGTWAYVAGVILSIFLVVGVMIANVGNTRSFLVSYSVWGIIGAVVFDVIMTGLCSKAVQEYEVRV
ncbi:MAG: hypothetical protein IJN54_12125 [Lachnospiraceae bacterium]|nr:hypothetical protein [Lachnospiraceae bacterium]